MNSVEITSAATDEDLSNNSATTSTDSPAIICLDLAIDKVGPGGTTHPGASVTYTVVISELNGVDAQQVVIADTLPTGATWVSDTSGTCGLVRQATTPGVVWTKALWAGGTRCEFRVTVRVGDTACRDDTLVNGVEITSATTDIDPSNNSATTGIDSPAILCLDLAVTKDDGQGAVPIQQPDKVYVITYTITYSNEGAVDASGVVLTDTLPAGTQVYDSNGWTCTGGVCTWPVGGLPIDARRTAPPLVVQLLDCGDLRNEVAIGDDGSHGPDYDPADNTSAITTTVPCLPDLRVVKNDNVGPIPKLGLDWITGLLDLAPPMVEERLCVRPGELITYYIAYVNTGVLTATQVVLTETLPEYTSYVGGGWTCVGRTCTLSVGALGLLEGGAADFVVRVDAVPPDSLVLNEVRIAGAEPDADPSDNVSYDDTPICEVCLQVRKDADVPCAFPGDEIHYTIVFTNACDLPASGVVLTETLPDYTSHPPIADWTPIGGDQFTYDYGSLPAHSSDSVEFVVVVDDPLPQTVTETINEVCIGRDGIAGAEDCDTEITPLPLEADLRVVKHDYIGLPPLETRQRLDRFYQALYGHPYRLPTIQQEFEPVKPGDVYSYTITYLNLGRAPATGVVLTETLPARTTYVGYVWTPAGGNVYNYTVGNLGVGMGGQVDFWVRVNPSACGIGDYLYNWAYIGGDQEECRLDNNWSGEETPVELPPCVGTVYLPILMKDYAAPVEPTPPPPPTDGYVSDVAVNPETNRVYVASPSLNAVFAVDPAVDPPTGDGSVIATIPVGDHPSGLAVVTTTNKIYAANFGSHNVTAIDGSTHTPIIDITVGVEPCKVAADSADGRVYVTHHKEIDNGAAAIDSQTDQFIYYYTRMHATQARYGIDVDPDPAHEKLFIAARDAGLIAIQAAYYPGVDPQVFKLDPPRVPFVVAFNPTTSHLFVTADDPNLDDDLVVVLDPYSIQWTRGTWVTMRGRQVFLLSRTNAGWIKEIDVGRGAEEGIAVNPLTGYVYVTNADDDTVSILRDDPNPANIVWIKDLPVGDRPQGVDVDILRNLIYVGNSLSRDLTVIDGATNTYLKTIPLY